MTDLFTLKESTRYPGLFVKKYKRKVFYDNLWNDDLVESRGRVFDKDGNVVINPFTKIFNYGENGTIIPDDEPVLAVAKINGFMAAATYIPFLDEVVISTTGSLDSDFVILAEKYITERVKNYIKDFSKSFGAHTFLFEICDPNDPHIIIEEPGAYLIGKRVVSSIKPYYSNEFGEYLLDVDSISMRCYRPDYFVGTFNEIKNLLKESHRNIEGFVVYSKTTALKIKTPYYLATKAIARSKDIFKLKRQFIDEEYYPLIDFLKNIDGFNEFTEEQKLHLIRNYYGN